VRIGTQKNSLGPLRVSNLIKQKRPRFPEGVIVSLFSTRLSFSLGFSSRRFVFYPKSQLIGDRFDGFRFASAFTYFRTPFLNCLIS